MSTLIEKHKYNHGHIVDRFTKLSKTSFQWWNKKTREVN